MLDRFKEAAPLVVAALLASGCEKEVQDVHIRASACMDAFQSGDKTSEESFTLTPDADTEPVLARDEDQNVAGFLMALDADSTLSAGNTVDVEGLVDQTVGVAYEGSSPWTVDPTTVHSVALSTENPNRGDWADVYQGVYAGVDMTTGQTGDTWDLSHSQDVSVSYFTHDCLEIVEDLNGQVAVKVRADAEGIDYLN